jgi:hypothetical protein
MEGISNIEEDENDATTNLGDDTEAQFDSNDNKEFDPEYNIQDVQDINIRGYVTARGCRATGGIAIRWRSSVAGGNSDVLRVVSG